MNLIMGPDARPATTQVVTAPATTKINNAAYLFMCQILAVLCAQADSETGMSGSVG